MIKEKKNLRAYYTQKGSLGLAFIELGPISATCRLPLPGAEKQPTAPRKVKEFPYNKYSHGKEGAVAAARVWRNERAKKNYGEYWKIHLLRVELQLPLDAHLYLADINDDLCWCASWMQGPPHDRQKIVKSFSVKSYGEDRAKDKALKALERGKLRDTKNLEKMFQQGGVFLPKSSPLLKDLPQGISRRKSDTGTPAWAVVAYRFSHVPLVDEFFCDKDYGYNAKTSLAAAKAFLAQETARLLDMGTIQLDDDGAIKSLMSKQRIRRGAQLSGIVRYYQVLVDGSKSWYWQVSWSQYAGPGKYCPKGKGFRDNRYRNCFGEPASWWSFIEALNFRRDKEIELYGSTKLPDPNDTEKVRMIYQDMMRQCVVEPSS